MKYWRVPFLIITLLLCVLLTGCYEPLVLSGITVSDISQNAAVITWQTDKAGDSLVEYGLTAEYGLASSEAAMFTDHRIILIGLAANTTYHFRVSSSDELGVVVESGDYAFTTLDIIQPDVENGDYLVHSFVWFYDGSEWVWDIQIPEQLYAEYTNKPRPPTEDYSVYVTDPLDDHLLDSLAEEINSTVRDEGFDEYEKVNFAIAFVQSLPYTSDWVTTPYDEYPRYPVETLVDGGGDCEDTSILMAAILDSMGYDVVLINPPGHLAVGVLGGGGISGSYYVHDGKKYYYVETTGEGWEIGEIPDEYQDESVYIYDIVPIPILTHDWSATTRLGRVNLEVKVENLGTAGAEDVYVLAGFDAGDGMLWNPVESELFDLEPGSATTIGLVLEEPSDKHTRLIVQIVDDGYAVDDSYSDWIDT